MNNDLLRKLLRTLSPAARERLSDVLIRDQADRDANLLTADALPRPERQGWADIIDVLTMYPEARRQVARLLAEIDAR